MQNTDRNIQRWCKNNGKKALNNAGFVESVMGEISGRPWRSIDLLYFTYMAVSYGSYPEKRVEKSLMGVYLLAMCPIKLPQKIKGGRVKLLFSEKNKEGMCL